MSNVVKIRPSIKCCFECAHSRDNAMWCNKAGSRTRFERSPRGQCTHVGYFFIKRIGVCRDA